MLKVAWRGRRDGGKVAGKGGKGRIDEGGVGYVPWAEGEKEALWKCFIRSGGRKDGGYIRKIRRCGTGKG